MSELQPSLFFNQLNPIEFDYLENFVLSIKYEGTFRNKNNSGNMKNRTYKPNKV